MFKKKHTELAPGLNEAIELAIIELKMHDPHTEEYAKILTQIERLKNLNTPDRADKVSKDSLVGLIGNLTGIGMIISYEHAHALGSKALGFVKKIP